MNDSEIERLKRRVDELEKAQPKKSTYKTPNWFKFVMVLFYLSIVVSVLLKDVQLMILMFLVLIASIVYMAIQDITTRGSN
jgi:hypothetical protein